MLVRSVGASVGVLWVRVMFHIKMSVSSSVAPGRQRRSFRGGGLSVKDQPVSSARSGELGDGLRPGQEAWRLHQSVPVSSLDIHRHEGERLSSFDVFLFVII